MQNDDPKNIDGNIDEPQDISGSEREIVERISSSSRSKSGTFRIGVVGKFFFSFFIFVGILGAIGFGVVWIIDHEQTLNIKEKQKPNVSEVIKNVDEKIVSKDPTENDENISKSTVQQSSDQITRSLTDPAKLPILVLNAGGTKGSAGKASDFLKQSGYLLSQSGNASVFTYKNVTVYYSVDSIKDDANGVVEALKKNYSVVNLAKAGTVDEKKEKIVVMIGE